MNPEFQVSFPTVPLKRVCRQINTRESRSDDPNRPYVGLENVQSWTGSLVGDLAGEGIHGTCAKFRPSHVLFAKLRPYLAKAFVAEFEGDASTEFVVLEPSRKLNPRFLQYTLTSEPVIDWFTDLTYGAMMPRLSPSELMGSRIPLPTRESQRTIANFLDRETTHIDTLVEQKERLIELLDEKRSALITHAVTKGLDPDVPMKDSGIEWIGDIPEHWEVAQVRQMSTLVTSGSRGWGSYYTDEGEIFLRIGNVSCSGIELDLSDSAFVQVPSTKEAERARTRPGDVLLSITALIGASAVVPEQLPRAYVNQHLALIRPRSDRVIPGWLAHFLQSSRGQALMRIATYGGTKQGLSLNDVRSIQVPLPPLGEQQILARSLAEESKRSKDLASALRTSITLLRERRSALITAAVTGQIDVADYDS